MNKQTAWLCANSNNITVVIADTLDQAHKQAPEADTFQAMEEYNLTTYSGKILNTLYYQFYSGNLILFNGSKTLVLKIEESHEFTYKFLKTKVKAINGLAGLLNWMNKVSKDTENPLNRVFFGILDRQFTF